ncbi:MAG: FAD-dependent oxidoreductase, partial [Alphaproteobacteria bacterium]|nr:FAD-dependent oxidoreductase [Alphaproteobacteria bacterium]
MKLSQELTCSDLYTKEGLRALDARFVAFVEQFDPKIVQRLLELRLKGGGDSRVESEMIVDLAPFLERFLQDLFMLPQANELEDLRRLYSVKRYFVQRILLKEKNANPLPDPEVLDAQMRDFLGAPFDEILFANKVYPFMDQASIDPERMKFLIEYAHFATKTEAGQSRHQRHNLFKFPEKVDFEHLVPAVTLETEGIIRKQGNHPKARDGFNLVDSGLDEKEAFDAASYCIKCGPQGKDSCSKGLKDGQGVFKTNPLENVLKGCPLEQKISEMMTLYEAGYLLGALSIVMIDNPLLALTGHRICNDCMKACIFQKQDPVDIPGVESAILKAALRLPYGFEIYSLLTRWNPLKFKDILPLKSSTHSVLVVGLGPAGIALSYYLTHKGIRVVGIDGTKIEPLDQRWAGVPGSLDFELLESTDVLFDDLEKRVIDGFGGVMEYGITARWDKNVLAVMRLILERTPHFRLYDGIRYGGTLGALEAETLGFDHVALCVGAGAPKIVPIKNNFSKGVRFAADFLMSLQLTGAYKRDALVNYDIELPLVVIGAGLTAIDTATEALAYYPRLVERFQSTYDILVEKLGIEALRACWTEDERFRAERYLSHAGELLQERLCAHKEDRAPNFLPLLNAWGGVTLLCRTPLSHTQSYKLNHLEVRSALFEGIQIVDEFSPTEFEQDAYGHVMAVLGVIQNGQSARIAARTVLMATGTGLHTLLEEEQSSSPDFSSLWGDCNPSYAGSVVKAIANVKDHHGALVERLRHEKSRSLVNDATFFATLDQALRAKVHDIRSIASGITELVIEAPLAARNSKPGQFFKVQPYARTEGGDEVRLSKSVALSRAWADEEKGLIGFVVLEGGVSTML